MMSLAQGSSGSEADAKHLGSNEKKRRRMLSNRESARRSRMRKQKHLEDLTREMGELERENREIVRAYEAKSRCHLGLQWENDALLAEKAALENYLNSMESIISSFRQNGQCQRLGSGVQEPWLVHSPSQQMVASASMSRI
ncbi:bZIP transcription factor 2-like [Rhodamnia argentea]|uniref:BZIP transcription factor 2-like n=1 Tax=Rhodamnia argentea TaxID=178133 RepID=A0A8B8PYQ5_9MYRT|nr:bZIP transcription factor 2-like [Rhodamnia argentea]